MATLVIFWLVFGCGFGAAAAFIEGKVNRKPARYKSAILWTVLLGPLGFLIVLIRSSLNYSGGMRADLRAAAQQKQVPQTPQNPEQP